MKLRSLSAPNKSRHNSGATHSPLRHLELPSSVTDTMKSVKPLRGNTPSEPTQHKRKQKVKCCKYNSLQRAPPEGVRHLWKTDAEAITGIDTAQRNQKHLSGPVQNYETPYSCHHYNGILFMTMIACSFICTMNNQRNITCMHNV